MAPRVLGVSWGGMISRACGNVTHAACEYMDPGESDCQGWQQGSLQSTGCFYINSCYSIWMGCLGRQQEGSSDFNTEAFAGTRLSSQEGVEAPAEGQTVPALLQDRAEVKLHLG